MKVIITCNSSNLITDLVLQPVIKRSSSHHSSCFDSVFEDSQTLDWHLTLPPLWKQTHAHRHTLPGVIFAFCCLSLLFFSSVISIPSLWGWWIFRSPPFLRHNFTDSCINRQIKIFDSFLGGSVITSREGCASLQDTAIDQSIKLSFWTFLSHNTTLLLTTWLQPR